MVDIPKDIRRGVNRGFKNPRRAGSVNPRVRGLETTRGRDVEGAPKLPKVDTRVVQNYPPVPDSWGYSEGEWIIYWYLSKVKGFAPERDFYHQAFAYVPFLFARKTDTSADFLIPYGFNSRLGFNTDYQALIFDPYDDFTHDAEFDRQRLIALEETGYKVVYMKQQDLMLRHKEIIEAGLQGRDLSDRGTARGSQEGF